ncbi:MAG: glycine zipper 2TM domain-containing protein [Alphaproteobacteria bacterium]|nr:glycine zipper 2TM domain-containing protein [Alphaproteobacteria bacterium]
MKRIFIGLIMASFLTACAQQGSGYGNGGGFMTRSDGGVSKSGIGTIAGGAAGAIAGSNVGKGKGNIAAIAVGTLLGAALGNNVGQSLDNADISRYNQTSQRTLETAPSGQQVAWNNPDSGNYGTITPVNVYQNDAGQYCREYSQTINVGGRNESAYGRACRQPNGSWRIVE